MAKNGNDRDGVRFRKQNSGVYNRKLKQSKEAMTQSLADSLTKLFDARAKKSQALSQLEIANNESVDIVFRESSNKDDNVENNESRSNCNKNDNILNEEVIGDGHVEPINEIFDLAKEFRNEDSFFLNGNLKDEIGNEEKQSAINLEKVIGVYCNRGTMTKNGNDKHQVGIRKKHSGAYNRKLKQRRDATAKSLSGSISKLFNARAQKSLSFSQVEEADNDIVDMVIDREPSSKDANGANNEVANEKAVDEGHMKLENGSVYEENKESKEMHTEYFVLGNGELRNGSGNKEKENMADIKKDDDVNYDPGLWGKINDAKRIMLVQRGPIKILKDQFPKDKTNGRRFSSKHYSFRHNGGDDYERQWLIYSNELNKVFCFCCKLFKSSSMQSNLAQNGVNDWGNITTKLQEHERNIEHKRNFVRWVDLKKALKLKATIDKQMQAQIDNVANNELRGNHTEVHLPIENESMIEDADAEVCGEGHVKPINGSVYVANGKNKEMCNEEKEVVFDLDKDAGVNYDPGLWGKVNDAKRLKLVQRGPIKIMREYDDFPRDRKNGRRFSSKHYSSSLINGEKYERKWLVYSNEWNRVYCFCCKLFKSKPMSSNLAEIGVNDWHHLSAKLLEHERNPEHRRNTIKWVDMKNQLNL